MKEDVEEMILDLLCKHALYGLTPEEEKQLAELQAEAGGAYDRESFELTVAALHMAAVGQTEAMPASLQAKILDNAGTYVTAPAEEAEENVFTRPRRPVEAASTEKGSMWNWLGWAVAAAACVALAFNLYLTRSTTEIVRGPQPTPSPVATATPAPTELRERLLAAAPDVTRAEWAAGNVDTIKEISGDVVWSDQLQEGYMRFRGLPPNDASKEQYQLWIFDETQPEKTPIDGGTFDVSADGEVIIPIDARLKARNPALFAVTIEKPGGVVVSDRKRLATVAPVKPGEA
jgi:anti-sigma-K factor RskA